MTDLKTIIWGLKCCMSETICASQCPYKGQCDDGGYYYSKAIEDAISRLKAQEPVDVGNRIKAGGCVLDYYECGFCNNAIKKPWNYCPFCGRGVKWNGR